MRRNDAGYAKPKMMAASLLALATIVAGAHPATAATIGIASVADRDFAVRPLPVHVGGRADRSGGGAEYVRQWPGTYFETAFRGTAALFRIGAGEVILHVVADSDTVATLVRPPKGLYRISGLVPGRHRLRIEVASESQAGPSTFGGFYASDGSRPADIPPRPRQIEFIGDSHTVGYANMSTKRDCTQDEVWASTDTSQAFGAMLARRYDADYQINAISGRGMVRNYNGFTADTVPQIYPYVLFDEKTRVDQPDWHPQVIVIALGTNDFTTPLHADEKWKTREALHADYESNYIGLVRSLRRRDPHAFIILWATDMANGEIAAETAKVADALRASGEARLAYVPVNGLSFSSCHMHPSLADEVRLAALFGAAIDARRDIWRRPD